MLMIKAFNEIKNMLQNMTFANNKFNPIIRGYTFHHVSQQIEKNDKNINLFRNSEVIIINKFKEKIYNTNVQCYIMAFEKTIFLLDNQKSFNFVQNLFSSKDRKKIIFLNETKDIFNNNCKVLYEEFFYSFLPNEQFLSQMKIYNLPNEQTNKIWKCISNCISTYLINKSFLNIPNNRIENFFKNHTKEFPLKNKIKDDEFIKLKRIGYGSKSTAHLIYHIEMGKLFIIKECIGISDKVFSDKEIKNYPILKHPLVPQYIGTTEDNKLVIEFIKGQTLEKINSLTIEDGYNIILQLLIIIEYIHFNLYIHDDIKPDNILIDDNNNLVLIDFDSMILENSKEERIYNCSTFTDPKHLTYFGDIYSIGRIIEFIIKLKKKDTYSYSDLEHNLTSIYLKCITENINDIPTIFALTRFLYYEYNNYIKISNIDELLKLNMDLALKNIGKKKKMNIY